MKLPIQETFDATLGKFMVAYTIAAESAMGVPEEIYAIAPLAARYLKRQKAPMTKVMEALCESTGTLEEKIQRAPEADSVQVFFCHNPACHRPHVVLFRKNGEPIAHFVVPDVRPGEGFYHDLTKALRESALRRADPPIDHRTGTQSEPDENCLHCELMQCIQAREDVTGNEVMAALVQVTAEVIGSCPDETDRRDMLKAACSAIEEQATENAEMFHDGEQRRH